MLQKVAVIVSASKRENREYLVHGCMCEENIQVTKIADHHVGEKRFLENVYTKVISHAFK